MNPQSARVVTVCNRGTTTKAPEKVEVFIDDKRVLVDPGTTVLQVGLHQSQQGQACIVCSQLLPFAVVTLLKNCGKCETAVDNIKNYL
jgi:hypothetical protein